jgi:plasmid replication initiation protein
MQLVHNYNLFGSCIIHILYTECAKTKKNNSGAERLKRNVAVESVEVLRKKTKSIKNVYQQELTKIEKSKKSGAGTDDIYQPQLAWFKRADIFLKNVVSSRTTTSNLVPTLVLLHNFSYFYYIHL